MSDRDLDRRNFHKLTIAALGGALAGAAAGCNSGTAPPENSPVTGTPSSTPPAGKEIVLTDQQVELLTDEKHTCRGLNVCKGQGRSKENECAGQGTCASVVDTSCGGQNDCATLGGCGATAGLNDCKGKGGCHIPLMDDAWTKARSAFETAMKKKGKEFGPAPAIAN